MKKQRSTSGHFRPLQPPRSTHRSVAPIASLIAIFLIALVAVTALMQLMVTHFTERAVSLTELATSESAVLILAASLVVTLIVGSLLLMLWPEGKGNGEIPPPMSKSEITPSAEKTVARPDARQILRLTRNAERLDTVEQDLIRIMAHGGHFSDHTHRLLTEMRVCTCKLLGELSDLDRFSEAPTSPGEENLTEVAHR